jgi:hypothetical protein
MKNKLLFVLLLVSSFAFGQYNDGNDYYPSNRIIKNDTVINNINLSSLYLKQAAQYQKKSLKMSLIGAVVSPLIGYIGVTNNNRDIINLSYIIGFSFAFNAIDFKLKSIESLKKAGENFH